MWELKQQDNLIIGLTSKNPRQFVVPIKTFIQQHFKKNLLKKAYYEFLKEKDKNKRLSSQWEQLLEIYHKHQESYPNHTNNNSSDHLDY